MKNKIILFFLLFFCSTAVAGCATFSSAPANMAELKAAAKSFGTSKGCFNFSQSKNKKELDVVKIPCPKAKPIFDPVHGTESCWCRNRTLKYFWRKIPARYLNSKNCCRKNFI